MIALSHIHPMMVHFPIVLLIGASALFMVVAVKRGNIAAKECLPLTGAGALVIGVLMAYVAAFFGDIAHDAAVSKGFPHAPIELHAEMAMATIALFTVLAAVLLAAIRKEIALTGRRAWSFSAAAALGVVLLIITAYFGGELVYRIGINVNAVVPVHSTPQSQ